MHVSLISDGTKVGTRRNIICRFHPKHASSHAVEVWIKVMFIGLNVLISFLLILIACAGGLVDLILSNLLR